MARLVSLFVIRFVIACVCDTALCSNINHESNIYEPNTGETDRIPGSRWSHQAKSDRARLATRPGAWRRAGRSRGAGPPRTEIPTELHTDTPHKRRTRHWAHVGCPALARCYSPRDSHSHRRAASRRPRRAPCPGAIPSHTAALWSRPAAQRTPPPHRRRRRHHHETHGGSSPPPRARCAASRPPDMVRTLRRRASTPPPLFLPIPPPPPRSPPPPPPPPPRGLVRTLRCRGSGAPTASRAASS